MRASRSSSGATLSSLPCRLSSSRFDSSWATTTMRASSVSAGPGRRGRNATTLSRERSTAGWCRADMLILGIESATPQVGCAIGGHEGVLASFHSARGQRHAETLAPAIDFVRRHALIEFGELGAIAVDVGPGLFTGLRVGIATAKALAQTLRVPMIGVSSLDLLAFPLRYGRRLIVPVIDARRGEVFYAFYRQVPVRVQLLSPCQV